MGYIKGTTSLTQEVNISKAMAGASPDMAGTYVKLAGYTRGWDGTNLAVMLPQDEDPTGSGIGVFVSMLNGTTKVTGLKKNIGHANDGAYFNEQYFFATGGAREGVNSKIIKCYGMDLKHDGDYTFTGPKNDISCISHIVNNYFFLGKGNKIYVCWKDSAKMTFDEVGQEIVLPVENTVVGGWTNQGMYCRSDKLYKIYGENVGKGGQIKRNYIAVFDLKGECPKYTGASLSAVYSCNRTEKFLFEVQGIDVSTKGEIRIAVDKRDAGVSDYKAGVYLVKLNN